MFIGGEARAYPVSVMSMHELVNDRIAGEPYLEDVLRRSWVRVLRPETVPLAEQLRNYRAATDIVFAEGSALHALQLLGRVDADVAVLGAASGEGA